MAIAPLRLAAALAGAVMAGAWMAHTPVQAAVSSPAASPLGSRDRCERHSGLPDCFGRQARAGMVAVPGGRFEPGSHQGYADERPAREPRTDAAGLPAVIEGGSFPCAANHCVRYRDAARHPQEADLGGAHVDFRTVSSRL
jgi:formylglycine-generating enzyme required for sulfatase activity